VFAQEPAAPPAKPAPARHVILCGSGGEEEFVEKFREWGRRLRDALVTRAGAAPENVSLLVEAETESPPPDTTTSLDSIRALFTRLAQSGPMDDVFVYLIGHGSYLKNESKFQIPGPDLTAEDLKGMLDALPAKRIAVIDGTSASAGFINVLTGPNRIICSATKSTTEVNAPEFMRLFIEAIEDGSADRNRDERISVREACEQAADLTATYYSSATLIATEHAILDDNGDGLGSRLPIQAPAPAADPAAAPDPAAANLDGAFADTMYVKDFSFPANAPQDLINGYLATLDEIKALKATKSNQIEDEYYASLEKLLIKAARTHRDIRAYAEPPGAAAPTN
jgi:hypothetical protein